MCFEELRCARADELEGLAALAREFTGASRLLSGFRMDRFCETWRGLLASGAGVVFVLVGDAGFAGALGGVAYPDVHSGELIATEFFWFVHASERGGGVRLYRAFEAWARERGCRAIRMVHLVDSMPRKLERFYRAAGFEAAEVHYTKEL